MGKINSHEFALRKESSGKENSSAREKRNGTQGKTKLPLDPQEKRSPAIAINLGQILTRNTENKAVVEGDGEG